MRFSGCAISAFLFLAWGHTAQAATPLAACTDGVATVGSGSTAVSYPCLRVDLMSHLSIPELGGTADDTEGENNAVSDIWGWVADPDGTPATGDEREFAIVGLYCSTAFVEIVEPVNPADPVSLVLVGTLADHTELTGGTCYEAPTPKRSGAQKHEEAGAVWRDIKVINDYAYIVSDHTGAGLQVFDLSRLLAATPPTDFTTEDGWEGTFGKAHNLFVYQGVSAPYAVVVGSNEAGAKACPVTDAEAGGPIFYDLTNPLDPVFAGKYCDDGYTHDIQCVVYTGPDTTHQNKEICLASNEDTLTIFDATDKTVFVQLAREQYTYVSYTHQGWLDDEQTYFYQNDELDEKNHGIPTRTLVWNVSNLDDPQLAEEYLAPVGTIDHNNYVIGDYLYQSNYTSGLRILDISDRENPYQKAFFDTYPTSDSVTFNGSWSNYAWYPSGMVAVSDINSGLFVVQPVFDETNSTDIAVTVSAPQSSYMYQVPFTYTLEATNNGALTAADVFATLRLSPSLTFNSQSESTSECVVVAPQLMECRLGDVGAGVTETVTVQAAGFSDSQGSAIAMVSAAQKDPTPANNRMQHQVTLTMPPVDDGGGAMGWLLLPVLLSLAWLRRRS